MPQGVDLVYMCFVGVFAFCGQVLFNAGVQKEKAGFSSLMRNVSRHRLESHHLRVHSRVQFRLLTARSLARSVCVWLVMLAGHCVLVHLAAAGGGCGD